MNSKVSSDQLRRALSIKEQIESLESQLNSLLSGWTSIHSSRNPSILGGGRRRMSASARARIAAAQRARWAGVKRQSSNNPSIQSSATTGRPRRKMSAAGRAAIAAAARARWARYNAGK
ncbi:MAG TPA: hypothetical protein VJ063_11890 [Verrucomicrobiae bacterium]|nr:hypothetical protein [Verrucomicrobiae bacterium]